MASSKLKTIILRFRDLSVSDTILRHNYCEYAKFDFSRFDVSWLLNLYPHTLEQIAKNAKVKERVRVAIATTLDGEAIAPSDSQRLQSILVKHFC